MTQTQRKLLEIPILLLLLWLTQGLEISLLRLPFGLGSLDVIPVLVTYTALTRHWYLLGALSFAFAFIGSSTVAYSAGIYIGVQMWTALVTKICVKAFALEGRGPFTGLAVSSWMVGKILTGFLLSLSQPPLPLGFFFAQLATGALSTALIAWLFFPAFVGWDKFFEHEPDEARDLSPDILG